MVVVIQVEDLDLVAEDLLAAMEASDSFCDFEIEENTLPVRWFESYRNCHCVDDENSSLTEVRKEMNHKKS
jgi:hypothetical protein